MGANKSENAGSKYYSVANGKLVLKHKEPNKDTVTRVNKKGNTVHEEFFNNMTGVITGISVKPDTGYGKQWEVSFMEDGQKSIVQMSYSGRYSSSFLKALPNLEQGKTVKFMPWEMDDNKKPGKTITGITLYQDQDGNGMTKVPSAYTKEDPNGLPEMKKVKVKGVQTWDDTDMMEFLEQMAADWMKSAPAVSDTEAEGERAPF